MADKFKNEQTAPLCVDGLSQDISYAMWKRGMVAQDPQPRPQGPAVTS
jgi:hypothetical protein